VHLPLDWPTWSLFAATEVALCLTPGPAVLLVVSQALSRGAGPSVWSNLGILSGNTFYFALSATGLGAILLASSHVFFAIKWIGAVYLVWLGISAFRGRSPVLSVRPAEDVRSHAGQMYLNGVVLQISNPKALVFFAALLPQFVHPSGSIAAQIAVLAVTSVVIEFFVLFGYGLLAGRATHLASQPRFATVTNRVSGVMLITAGAGMAALRRA
jgi:threonine/homoserine/homoserine lactone efflux protein